MTLHYSRTRMDAPSPIKDAGFAMRTRPATAGPMRDELVPGGMQFYDSVTSEPLGGSARRRPNTARGNLGGQHSQAEAHHAPSRFTAAARMSSMRLFPAQDLEPNLRMHHGAMNQYRDVLTDAGNEVEEMMQSER